MENKIKIIFGILLVGLMIFPMISAVTPTDVVWSERQVDYGPGGGYIFTDITYKIDGVEHTNTFRPKDMFVEVMVEEGDINSSLVYDESYANISCNNQDNFNEEFFNQTSNQTEEVFNERLFEDVCLNNILKELKLDYVNPLYITYVNETFYASVERVFGEQPLENITVDVIQAHDFQYGSAGWNETYTPAQLRTALEKISVNDDGSINKTSYPEQLVSCVGDTCYLQMGKTQSFIIVLLQMVNDWISGIADRVTGTENRLDEIESDLCNQGFTKYC